MRKCIANVFINVSQIITTSMFPFPRNESIKQEWISQRETNLR